MTRLVFAVAVPLLAAVIGGIVAVDAVMLGFAGEGCRSHDGTAFNWRAGSEAGLIQLLFGIGFAIALGSLSSVLNRRAAIRGETPSGLVMEKLAIAGYLALSAAGVIGLAACSMSPYVSLSNALLWGGWVCLAAAAVRLVVSYLRGLASSL